MGSTGRDHDLISLEEIVNLRPEGIFLQMKSEIFYILACDFSYHAKRYVRRLIVRELISGEISEFEIWRRGEAPVVRYIISSFRPGFEKSKYRDRYEQEITNPRFHVVDLRQRLCIYTGDCSCIDLENGKAYSLAHCPSTVQKELSGMSVGDVLSVCTVQNRIFLLASYKYGSPSIKAYQKSERVLLKRGKRFKRITAEIGSSYVVRSIIGYAMKNVGLYEQPSRFSPLSADICEELNLAYGYAYGFEQGEKKEIYFTNLADSKMYTVPIESVDYGTFYGLCKGPRIVGAHITDAGSYQAYVIRVFERQDLGTLEFLYTDKGYACYMDSDTFETYDIPFRYLPKGIKENELLTGCYAKNYDLRSIDPKGKVYLLRKL